MDKMASNFIWQISIVVRDIQRTAENYARTFGMHMPEIIEETLKIEYKGVQTQALNKLAFFKMGLIQLELIEPCSELCCWRDFLDEHGEGVYHIAFFTEDMDSTLEFMENRGIKVLQKGEFERGAYYYMDSADKLGIVLSLAEKYRNKGE